MTTSSELETPRLIELKKQHGIIFTTDKERLKDCYRSYDILERELNEARKEIERLKQIK